MLLIGALLHLDGGAIFDTQLPAQLVHFSIVVVRKALRIGA